MMWKLILPIVFSLLLGACAMGYESHVYDMDNELGSDWVFVDKISNKVIRVEFGDIWFVHKRCQVVNPNSEPLACAIWPTKGMKMNALARKFMDGAECIIITTPNKESFEHELKHCREGASHW